MDNKKSIKKVDFLKISKKEQEDVLRRALKEAQKAQREIEDRYDRVLAQSAHY